MIDPKGGKFSVAHDCGRFGLRQSSQKNWAAPKFGAAPSMRDMKRHMNGGNP